MKSLEEQHSDESQQNYQAYIITKSLKGHMSPTREGAILLINSKRKDDKHGRTYKKING